MTHGRTLDLSYRMRTYYHQGPVPIVPNERVLSGAREKVSVRMYFRIRWRTSR